MPRWLLYILQAHLILYLNIFVVSSGKSCLTLTERIFERIQTVPWGFPGSLDSKESACNAQDPGSIPGSGRSTAGGNSNPLQYSCLQNPMDRGAWWATVHGVAKSQT